MGNITDFDDKVAVSEFERTQIWNVANSEELLSKYKYAVKNMGCKCSKTNS